MRQNLIFSRRADDGVLSFSDVASRAPAAFSTVHAEGLSPRYGMVNTARAVEILDGFGWRPTQAAQKKARRAGGQFHAEHLLAFADGSGLARSTGERPEVVLYNSHDGTSSLRLFVGFYRFICSNGIVAGDGFEARIRHTSGTVGGFESMLADVVARIPAMVHAADVLKGRILTPAEITEAATRAAALRWDTYPAEYYGAADGVYVDGSANPLRGSFFTRETVRGLSMARRWDDEGADAWRVLNRIQEGVIRGGAMVRSLTERHPFGADRKARAVGSVAETVRLNRALWDIVADVAEVDLNPEPVALAVAA